MKLRTISSNSKCKAGIASLLLVVLLALIACGGGSIPLPGEVNFDTPMPPDGASPMIPAPAGDEAGDVVQPERTTLKLSYPALATLAPGSEFEAVVGGVFITEVYQGSLRLSYNPAVVEPVSVERGGLLLDDMVHVTGLMQGDHVPFAFTALPGHAGIAPGEGELLRVRFRLLDVPTTGQPLSLLNDAMFLQLRDRQGKRLGFDLESRMGVQP